MILEMLERQTFEVAAEVSESLDDAGRRDAVRVPDQDGHVAVVAVLPDTFAFLKHVLQK